jgi:hypothetical protein
LPLRLNTRLLPARKKLFDSYVSTSIISLGHLLRRISFRQDVGREHELCIFRRRLSELPNLQSKDALGPLCDSRDEIPVRSKRTWTICHPLGIGSGVQEGWPTADVENVVRRPRLVATIIGTDNSMMLAATNTTPPGGCGRSAIKANLEAEYQSDVDHTAFAFNARALDVADYVAVRELFRRTSKIFVCPSRVRSLLDRHG